MTKLVSALIAPLVVMLGCSAATDQGQGALDEGGLGEQQAELKSPNIRGVQLKTTASAASDLAIISNNWLSLGWGEGAPYTFGTSLDHFAAPGGYVLDAGYGASANWFDVDNDGRDELIIGLPGMRRSETTKINGGHVDVTFDASGNVLSRAFHIGSFSEVNEYWGRTVASGNFNGDAYEDYVLGSGVGKAVEYRGTSNGQNLGLTMTGSGDFAASMAAGDFNCDGYEDLAIGAPADIHGGQVYLYRGSSAGLVFQAAISAPAAYWRNGDQYGISVTAGNFNGDFNATAPCVDLAVGVAGYDGLSNNKSLAGATWFYYGTPGTWASGHGIRPDLGFYLDQDTTGVADTAETSDRFGSDVMAADFNADGFDDLAVLVINEYVVSASCPQDAAIQIFPGSAAGLNLSASLLVRSTGPGGMMGAAEKNKLVIGTIKNTNIPNDPCTSATLRAYTFPTSATLSAPSVVVKTPAQLGLSTTVGFAQAITRPHAGYKKPQKS